MTTLPTAVVVVNGFGLLFVILNTFALGLRLPVGHLLAQVLAHWQIAVWVLVINFIVIPLLFIGYVLTIASSIPGQIKVGFCVAALAGGMPFAPLLARVAKANVATATSLLVLLTAGTVIALPLGLPAAVAAVDAHVQVSVWNVAWPLLLFLLLPLVLGCLFRLRWPDVVEPVRRWVVPFAILCLLLNVNFTFYAFWNLFVQTWGTGSYIAAIADPFIGLGCGFLLVSILRVKDVGIRHATEMTTAIRNISAMLVVVIFPLAAYPVVNVAITALNTFGLLVVLVFALEWRHALSPSGARAKNAPEASPDTTVGTTLATD